MSIYIQPNENVQSAPVGQPSKLAAWLPTRQQMVDAVQLRFAYIAAPAISQTEDDESTLSDAAITNIAAVAIPRIHPLDITMRQGLGMVCAAALIAGLLPFIWNWTQAAQVGTALPLAQAAQNWSQQAAVVEPNSLADIMSETAQIVAGLPPRGPGGLAAFLSALGEWLNWPMRWLAVWIVYGLGVAGIALLLGARSTLQHFYAATSYAFIPLLLGALAFIPILGWLLGLIGVVWAVVIFFHATRAITGLDTLRVVISMIAPVAVGALALMLWVLVVVNVVWSALL